jgi:D-galactose 1-dehydrogenase
MTPIRMGLVGFGKIARDEHVPAIACTDGAELVAVASRHAIADGVPNFPDLAAMLSHGPTVDAILLCQPPQVRYDAAHLALAAGKHVFLEKPPGATLSEVDALVAVAKQQGVTLFASWHSRHSSPVARLKAWCAIRRIRHVTINWKEDVRRWHPGQDWIWESGGFGVFDPGINALSILTEVLPERVRLIDATLHVPTNRAAPIAAELVMETASGAPVTAAFDWRQTSAQTWEIIFDADDGEFIFTQGGNDATNAAPYQESALAEEYRALYRRFVDLVRTGKSDVDLAPLQLVADAFLRGRICPTDAFIDQAF